jgi:hypothetical protein
VLRDRLSMNMDLISQWGQGVVGVTLVLIGALGLKEAMELNEAAAEEVRAEAKAEYGRKFSLGTYFTGAPPPPAARETSERHQSCASARQLVPSSDAVVSTEHPVRR